MEQHLLEVQELHTSFFTHMGEVQAVRGVSFYVDQGEVIGVIGESGCGKSVTALSIMGLLSKQGRVTDGEVRFKGENLLSLSKKDRAGMRGKHIAMIFQDSMTSLDPVFTVGDQMSEVLRYHTGIGKEEALARCIEMLGLVGMQEPENGSLRIHMSCPEVCGSVLRQPLLYPVSRSSCWRMNRRRLWM